MKFYSGINHDSFLIHYDRGKNFVIKYEGSFKSGSADCLVLQHVQHDRPEVFIINLILLLVGTAIQLSQCLLVL